MTESVRDAASTVHASLADLGVQAVKFLNAVRSQRAGALDSALEQVGLQRRESALRPVLIFVAGAVVAGAVALALAPTSGKKLRRKIVELMGAGKDGDEASAGSHPSSTEQSVAQSVAQSMDGVVGR